MIAQNSLHINQNVIFKMVKNRNDSDGTRHKQVYQDIGCENVVSDQNNVSSLVNFEGVFVPR